MPARSRPATWQRHPRVRDGSGRRSRLLPSGRSSAAACPRPCPPADQRCGPRPAQRHASRSCERTARPRRPRPRCQAVPPSQAFGRPPDSTRRAQNPSAGRLARRALFRSAPGPLGPLLPRPFQTRPPVRGPDDSNLAAPHEQSAGSTSLSAHADWCSYVRTGAATPLSYRRCNGYLQQPRLTGSGEPTLPLLNESAPIAHARRRHRRRCVPNPAASRWSTRPCRN
jgi:hypothetical protein